MSWGEAIIIGLLIGILWLLPEYKSPGQIRCEAQLEGSAQSAPGQ